MSNDPGGQPAHPQQPTTGSPHPLRRRVLEIVQIAAPGDRLSRAFDLFLITLILANVVAMIAESVPEIAAQAGGFFTVFEAVSVLIFTIEYILRVWSCVERPEYRRPVVGRLRFALTPLAIIDLLAVLPFYLPFVGVDFRFVRVLRVFRLARVTKLARYNSAVASIGRVIHARRDELMASLSFMLMLIVVASSLLYFAERDAQPEHFGSIPAAMWWAVVTLTTVGYGDIFPVTAVGKMLAGSIAILGVGMVALPTSILGSGFVEEVARKRASAEPKVCPHCGKPCG